MQRAQAATIRDIFHAALPSNVPFFLGNAAEKVLLLDRLAELHDRLASACDEPSFFQGLLAQVGAEIEVSAADLDRIPSSGPVVAVANHPFGFLDGVMLGAMLPAIRPDVKIMANALLRAFPAARECFILVNPFGGRDARRQNGRGLKGAIEHLNNGGMLSVFPAGEVSHLDLRQLAVVDAEWSPTIARIVRITGATVVPMYFEGRNSLLFQVLGFVHPKLRTALLANEFLNKPRGPVRVRVGEPLPASKAHRYATDERLIDELRQRTYLLRHRSVNTARPRSRSACPTVDPVSSECIASEISRLPNDHRLAVMGEMEVWIGASHELPHTLREIGRLREITFRAAGEGTGKSLDIDEFDAHYIHLFAWHTTNREIVGAYRLGRTDDIIARFGADGLYTRTLFEYDHRFLSKMGKALEVGRSFVRAEYQKSFAALLILWRGIGEYIVRNPQYAVLYGPVSISNDYNPASRQLMVTYLNEHEQNLELSPLVHARSPFRLRTGVQGHCLNWDLEDLSGAVADVEPDRKGVPVLLRQYLKLGGKLAGFNLDRRFCNALDGLMVVDLRKTDRKALHRYLGRDGAESFLKVHGGMPTLNAPVS